MIEIIPNWHPLLVHFTVALLTISVVFFVACWIFKEHRWNSQWRTTAFWCLWVGVAISVLTVIAGWSAYNTVAHDTPSHAAMTEHRNLAITTFVLFVILALWSVKLYQRKWSMNIAFLAASLLGMGMLVSTGWHGSELVYRYGLGVISLPKSDQDSDHHAHDESAGHGHAPMTNPDAPMQKKDSKKPTTEEHHDDGHAHDH